MEAKEVNSGLGTNNREGHQQIVSEEQKYFLLNDKEVLDKIVKGLMKDFRLL